MVGGLFSVDVYPGLVEKCTDRSLCHWWPFVLRACQLALYFTCVTHSTIVNELFMGKPVLQVPDPT